MPPSPPSSLSLPPPLFASERAALDEAQKSQGHDLMGGDGRTGTQSIIEELRRCIEKELVPAKERSIQVIERCEGRLKEDFIHR